MMKRCLALVVLIVSLLAACQSAATPTPNRPTATPPPLPTPTPEAQVLIDALGREIVLVEPPERIAIAGRAAQLILHAAYFFDAADRRVVAMEQRTQRGVSMLPLVDSRFGEKMQLERDAGPEAIAAARPDMVLLKSYLAGSLGEPLEAIGLNTAYLDLETPEQFFRDVRFLGSLFGESQRAEQVLAFYQARLDRVGRATGLVSPETRPRVLLCQYSDQGGEAALNVPSEAWLQTTLVDLAGGQPVWLEAAGSGWTVVDFEQIATWDPDFIFVVYYRGDPTPIVEALRSDPKWAALTAVRAGRLLAFPGDFLSWDQPDPRWILGLQWMASRLLPEGAFEFDAVEEMRAFYGELYGLEAAAFDSEVLPLLSGDYVP